MAVAQAQLKRVHPSRLRLGMFIHSLEGDWMTHPFWKTRFRLQDAQDLQRLQASRVPACWIDLSRGLDEEPGGDAAADAPATAADPGPPPTASATAATAAATVPPEPRAAPPALPQTPPPPQPPQPPAPPVPAPAALALVPGARPVPAPTHSLAEEVERAADLCRRSREVVSGLVSEARLGHAVDVDSCQPLVQEVTDSVMRNPGALVSLARLKTADDYSYMHSVAVCALMVALGRQMGLDEAGCRAAGMAGLLHDLGKAAIPLEVLNKPGKLDPHEWAVVREHPVHGHRMLSEGGGTVERTAALEVALDVCLHHHERIDGKGYPEGLSGERLTLLARMGAVCDVYDAVTSNRPYKAGWDPADSISRMASWQGQFDPQVMQHFVRSLGIYPVGALVRLASGRLAVVVEQNPQALTRPVVRVFHDALRDRALPPQLLDLAAGTDDRIADREPPQRWNFPHLDALWAGEAALAARRG